MRFLLLSLLVLLCGCQPKQLKLHSEKSIKHGPQKLMKKPDALTLDDKDGAPTEPRPKSVKKIIPAIEPLSRYGNPGTYRVDGQTYNVMTTARGYHAKGLASWYGTKFHKKRTSSGEVYDLYALTAAHKTLPLPTYVKVTNLSNGLNAIVKVNDRGPFHNDRILDLSYGAALKLGLLRKGTAPVEIEVLTSPSPIDEDARYYLQLGAFSSENYAHTLRDKLAKITNFPIFVEPFQNLFLVKAGPIANQLKLDELKEKLLANGIGGAFSLMQ